MDRALGGGAEGGSPRSATSSHQGAWLAAWPRLAALLSLGPQQEAVLLPKVKASLLLGGGFLVRGGSGCEPLLELWGLQASGGSGRGES